MSVSLSYPGVYIEEVPSGVRTITGVATSITAFVGYAASGDVDEPIMCTSWADFERRFGGLHADLPMSYAVRDFYANQGSQALIVRVVPQGADLATVSIPGGAPMLVLDAASKGAWGNRLKVAIEPVESDAGSASPPVASKFNLLVQYTTRPGGDEVVNERILNLSTDPTSPRYVANVLKMESAFVRARDNNPGMPTDASAIVSPPGAYHWYQLTGGLDGSNRQDVDFSDANKPNAGIFALRKADLFNLLCIPPKSRGQATSADLYKAALPLCVQRRAMLIVDPDPGWCVPIEKAVSDTIMGRDALGLSGTDARNAALYFPCIREADPVLGGQIDTFAPCGMVAGIMARTDATRGVWKAPAGLDASLNGVQGLQVNLNDLENGQLNQLGVNCLRSFPVNGRVVWGARTLRGADQAADEYKYVPVRRLALFIEESLYRGTQWVVFEPNDEPLWGQIRLNVGAFMQNLFRQGAFQGKSAREAYLVKCDAETTTQNDINLGVVNIVVGFAPLKPAEFVVIKIQQLAGQVQA